VAPQAPERAGERDVVEYVRVLESLFAHGAKYAAQERGSTGNIAFAGPRAFRAKRRKSRTASLRSAPLPKGRGT